MTAYTLSHDNTLLVRVRRAGIFLCLALTFSPVSAQSFDVDDVVVTQVVDDTAPAAAQTSTTGGGAIAVLSAQATFDKYEVKLDPAGKRVLDNLLDELDTFTRILSIRVIGHADSRGGAEANLLLSFERAQTIERVLRQRFESTHITSTGAGETQPIADNATEEGRSLNRRVEVQVIALARTN